MFLILPLCACASHPKPVVVVAPPAVALSSLPIIESRPTLQPSIDLLDDEASRQMIELLGATLVPTPKPDSAELSISSDLEILSYTSNDRVEFFIDAFTGRSRVQTLAFLSRGTRFEPMIRAKLRAAEMPEDLYYLAFIESGFAPDAYSRSAAVGIWQFMTATAKGEGLRVDWWVDERRDPVMATDAAIRHLSWLRRQFGSLFLAAAAYNGGSGTISRGLTRHADAVGKADGEGMFFALAETNYLREETRDYVPKLIAAALVAKSAVKYEMSYDTLSPLEYDSVKVAPAIPLAAIAKASGSGVDQIASLNNHVLRGFTHPKDSMWIKVPVGSAEGFKQRYADLEVKDLVPYTKVTSKSGETFAAVAKRVGITAKRLAWYNQHDGTTKKALPVGTTILVPTAAVLAVAKDVPNPAIEIYGSGSRYVVRNGDTLGAIAKRYRTTVSAIRRLNGLKSDAIRVGQALRVR